MSVRFGPAGTPDSFTAMGYKKAVEIPDYLARFGLTAFEYQCGHGLRVNEQTVRTLGERCREAGIALSLHAPYYISLSSVEAEKRENSIGYLVESARVASWLGADRIVVHSGSCGKLSREQALEYASDTLKRAQDALDGQGYSEVHLCPETMGKINQLGDLDEVLALCELEERFLPCVDFGHLYARGLGALQTREDYERILDRIGNRLGSERAKSFHAHFSRIEFTEKGGEKCHLAFSDDRYGPEFEPLMELLAERGLEPRIICESAGTQAEDAAQMQDYYRQQI